MTYSNQNIILNITNIPVDTNKHNLKFNITNIGTSFDNTTYNVNNSYGNIIDLASYTLYIFGRNFNQGVTYNASVKIYDLKLYNATELIRHFIPAKRNNDNELGLHETVQNIFYTNNSGRGAFIAGSEI